MHEELIQLFDQIKVYLSDPDREEIFESLREDPKQALGLSDIEDRVISLSCALDNLAQLELAISAAEIFDGTVDEACSRLEKCFSRYVISRKAVLAFNKLKGFGQCVDGLPENNLINLCLGILLNKDDAVWLVDQLNQKYRHSSDDIPDGEYLESMLYYITQLQSGELSQSSDEDLELHPLVANLYEINNASDCSSLLTRCAEYRFKEAHTAQTKCLDNEWIDAFLAGIPIELLVVKLLHEKKFNEDILIDHFSVFPQLASIKSAGKNQEDEYVKSLASDIKKLQS